MYRTDIPRDTYLSLIEIIGDKDANPPIPSIFPVCRSKWLKGVKSGEYPKPKKFSRRTILWKSNDIIKLLDSMDNEDE